MSKLIKHNFREKLLANPDHIYLPNGELWEPSRPLLPVWDGDVWSSPRERLMRPEFVQGFSVFMHSAEARGDCGKSGDAWADFIVEHLTYRATGDFFNWDEMYFDRVALPKHVEASPCSCLGRHPGRTMYRLRDKMDKPSTRLASVRDLPRLCAYDWVWKVFAARAAHRPEFCGRLLP